LFEIKKLWKLRLVGDGVDDEEERDEGKRC
jgi:hypothetical protein